MSVCRTFVLILIYFLARGVEVKPEENNNSSNFSNFDFDDDFFAEVGDKFSYENNTTESRIYKIAKNLATDSVNRSLFGEPKENDRLANLLRVYNVGVLEKVWFKENRGLTNVCRQNMNVFLEALEKYELWALKGKLKNLFFVFIIIIPPCLQCEIR